MFNLQRFWMFTQAWRILSPGTHWAPQSIQREGSRCHPITALQPLNPSLPFHGYTAESASGQCEVIPLLHPDVVGDKVWWMNVPELSDFLYLEHSSIMLPCFPCRYGQFILGEQINIEALHCHIPSTSFIFAWRAMWPKLEILDWKKKKPKFFPTLIENQGYRWALWHKPSPKPRLSTKDENVRAYL